jgi:hypothetical protein
MITRLLFAGALAVGLAMPTAAPADTLPLPANLVGLDGAKGEALLFEAEARSAYFPLSLQFVTQENQAFCGVASLVMVLNALKVPAPSSPALAPFSAFDQENLFNDRTEAVVPRARIAERGMTLDQLGGLAAASGLKIEVRHAEDTTLDAFRRLASESLAADGRHVLVNYLRSAIGQEKYGHISPLAAYDKESDRFLILDVARYKYPPVWVGAAELFAAMNTPDADNNGRSRGFVLVSR